MSSTAAWISAFIANSVFAGGRATWLLPVAAATLALGSDRHAEQSWCKDCCSHAALTRRAASRIGRFWESVPSAETLIKTACAGATAVHTADVRRSGRCAPERV